MPARLEPAPPTLYHVGYLPDPLKWWPPQDPLPGVDDPELQEIIRDGNRWDAPDGLWGTLYLADTPVVAFAEVIATRFRERLHQAAKILEATSEDEPDPEYDFPLIDGGVLPRSFFEPQPPRPEQRVLARAQVLEECPPFVDVSHPDTHRELALKFGEELARLGIDGVDRGVVMQQNRHVTRAFAGYLYPRYHREAAGIRFESRFARDGWCYAAWENMRPHLKLEDKEPVTSEHPDLRAACEMLHIDCSGSRPV